MMDEDPENRLSWEKIVKLMEPEGYKIRIIQMPEEDEESYLPKKPDGAS